MGKALSAGLDDACKLEKSYRLMEEALGLLDEAGAPADIGAHLDAALCRLSDTLSLPRR
jgi:hypothetical protein